VMELLVTGDSELARTFDLRVDHQSSKPLCKSS
jgi:hypothetical protein